MSRVALLCCIALALLFSVGAAHAQQGNLPTPVQKLPAYPPVACVTPDWRPEPCEDRAPLPETRLPLINARNDRHAIECLKPAEPGWLGLGGLFQLLDCSWLGTTGYPTTPPRPQAWPEPKIIVFAGPGGNLYEHVAHWQAIAKQGRQVEILGPCYSACTFAVAYVPKERLCFGIYGSLNFHQVRTKHPDYTTSAPEATEWMINQYPADIRDWIMAKGGAFRMPLLLGFWTLSAEELWWKMGYRRCSE